MRINNVTSDTSAKSVVVMSVIVGFIVGGFIIAYVLGASPDLSFFGFFKWLFLMFQTFREECTDEPIIPWITLILPVICIVGLIAAINSRNNALKLFNTGLNIKYVDFLSDRLEFCFTKPEYNFVCAYLDVEKFDMDIKSKIVHTKNGSYVAFEQLNLVFSLLNNKKFELSDTPISPMKAIYRIIDYTRGVQNFNYYFTGAGEVPDYKDKIEKYLQSGYVDLVGDNREKQMMLSSLVFFTVGLCVFTPFIVDIIKEPIFLIMFFPLGLLLLIPLIIDIILVIDKIRDYKYFWGRFDNNKKKFYERINVFHLLFLKAIVCGLIFYFLLLPVIDSININAKFNKSAETLKNTSYRVLNDNTKDNDDNWVDLRINSTSDYDYMTKREIYDLRKRYVSESVFAKEDYEPDEEVFGQIVDNMPWWGNLSCDILNYQGDYSYRIEGDSKLSTMINNPAILVGLYKLFMPWEDPYYGDYCTADYSKFIPASFKYNKKDNLFITTYNVPAEFVKYKINITGLSGGRNIPMQLSGLNALDFGYKYVYGYDSKNIKMLYPESSDIMSDVQTFRDFIHLGGSCQYKGGCNNLSPLQTGLIFNVQNLPAEISLKLWKKHPSNKNSKADAYFKIVFE